MAYRPYTSKRTKRAQDAIALAMRELMSEKPFSDITITELCTRSGVSRPTFYRHFDATEDVIHYYAYEIINDMDARVQQLLGRGLPGTTIVQGTFEAAELHRDLFELLQRHELLSPLFGYLWTLQSTMAANPQTAHSPLSTSNASVIYSWGGTFSLLFNWIINGMNETPAQMAAIVLNAAQSVGFTFDASFHLPQPYPQHRATPSHASNGAEQ